MVQTIGIIGAGQMGSGIAHVAALNGFNITIIDISERLLQTAFDTIAKNMNRQVNRKKISQEVCDKALT